MMLIKFNLPKVQQRERKEAFSFSYGGNMKFTTETLKRALRTFIQAAVAYIVTHITIIDLTDADEVIKRALIGLVVAAISAGIAAAMNLEKKELEE